MEYKNKIIQTVSQFYVDCVEEFKEAEVRIANDSKFRTIFRKKDYKGNIDLLKECKSRSHKLKFPTGDIPKGDSDSKELIRLTEGAVRQFNRLCDAYIQMQIALQKKAGGEGVSYAEYKDIYRRSQEESVAMNRQLQELGLVYTDYMEDANYDVYEFL